MSEIFNNFLHSQTFNGFVYGLVIYLIARTLKKAIDNSVRNVDTDDKKDGNRK